MYTAHCTQCVVHYTLYKVHSTSPSHRRCLTGEIDGRPGPGHVNITRGIRGATIINAKNYILYHRQHLEIINNVNKNDVYLLSHLKLYSRTSVMHPHSNSSDPRTVRNQAGWYSRHSWCVVSRDSNISFKLKVSHHALHVIVYSHCTWLYTHTARGCVRILHVVVYSQSLWDDWVIYSMRPNIQRVGLDFAVSPRCCSVHVSSMTLAFSRTDIVCMR